MDTHDPPDADRSLTKLVEELRIQQAELEAQNEELRQTRLAAENARDRYEALFRASPLATLVVDLSGLIREYNPVASKLFTLHSARRRPQFLRQFTQTTDHGLLARALAQAHREGHSEAFGLHFIEHTGEVFPGDLYVEHVGALPDSHVLVCVLVDQRERQRQLDRIRLTESLVEANQARYRVLADYAPDWEFWLSPEGRFEYVSPACFKVTGYPAEAFYNDPGLMLRIVHPEDRPRFEAHLNDLREGEHVLTLRILDRAGKERWIEHQCRKVYDEQGMYLGRRGVNRDITEKHAMEQELAAYQGRLEELVAKRTAELEAARQAAEAANRAKSLFLANMSHELRTPLNAILGLTGLLRRNPNLDEEARHHLELVARSGEHLLDLISDVLEISRIESGRLCVQTQSFDLYELLDTLLAVMNERARSKGLTLRMQRAADLPRFIATDLAKLRQILLNLLSNAIKYTERGEVILRASVEGERLRIEVEDTGAGIRKEEQEAIFHPFYQTSAAVRQGEGTGLGLAIAREYALLLGGGIEVESTVGKGSVFRLTLPFQPGMVSVPPARRRIVGLQAGQQPPRVLIAEDDPVNQLVVQAWFAGLGFEVEVARNGEEALAAFRARRPDLVVMDMRMPVLDGYATTRAIRAMENGTRTPIIAFTASAMDDEQADTYAAGCDAVTTKPLREEAMQALLERLLDVKFVYAEDAPNPTPWPGNASAPNFALLPAPMRQALRAAAIACDIGEARRIAEAIRTNHPELARGLTQMIEAYDFDAILNACPE